ncbi:MAG TPA: VTT domain-containing protein [Methanoregula sp.]|nr:VTT domain-containing protein [Methanoregula sp.]
MIETILNLFLHLDQNLAGVMQSYGMWTYLLLFFIIFLETGLVIMPFLPGDSLLFVSGALAASGIMNLEMLIVVYILGAILGDTVNYWLGNYLGLNVFQKRFPNILKKEYIDQTYSYFEKYGGATIFIVRFVPIIRSLAPFLAGVGSMRYRKFLFYNVSGAIAWTLIIVLGGYYIGSFSIIQENMNLFLIFVILMTAGSVLVIIAGIVKALKKKQKPEGH